MSQMKVIALVMTLLVHYDTEDEAFADPIAANLAPVPGQPIVLDVIEDNGNLSYLPLCILFNSRSVYNKSDNLTEMLNQIGPDVCIVSETFERERKRLSEVIDSRQFKYISYYRKNRV